MKLADQKNSSNACPRSRVSIMNGGSHTNDFQCLTKIISNMPIILSRTLEDGWAIELFSLDRL